MANQVSGKPPTGGHGKAETAAAAAHNQSIARYLREAAQLLKAQRADRTRIHQLRRSADAIDGLDTDLGTIAEKGADALREIPGMEPASLGVIIELLRTGRWTFLDRLRGTADPQRVFRTIPGVGPKLAALLYDMLGVETLEELAATASDGRLELVPGVSRRRARALGKMVAEILSHRRPALPPREREPDIDTLLAIDDDYRRQAPSGALAPIPTGTTDAQHPLPVLHARLGAWHFTALPANAAPRSTAILIYAGSADESEARYTVVTAAGGALAGHRVVLGREAECRRFYLGPES